MNDFILDHPIHNFGDNQKVTETILQSIMTLRIANSDFLSGINMNKRNSVISIYVDSFHLVFFQKNCSVDIASVLIPFFYFPFEVFRIVTQLSKLVKTEEEKLIYGGSVNKFLQRPISHVQKRFERSGF